MEKREKIINRKFIIALVIILIVFVALMVMTA